MALMSGRHRRVQSSRPSRHGRHRKPPPRHRLIVPAVTAVAVVAGGGVAMALVVSDPGSHPASVRSVRLPRPMQVTPPSTMPSAAPLATSPPPAAAPSPAAHHSPAKPRRTPPLLALTVTGHASYFAVSSGGHVLVQRIYHHGQHLDLRRRGLLVVIGNAGDVRLSVHGHPARLAGRPGQVRDITVR